MEKKKRIFEYLDARQGNTGTDAFEADLKNDDALYGEFLAVKESLAKFDALAEVEPDNGYFESVVPRFREKLEAKRSRAFAPLFWKLGGAVAVPALAVTLFITQPWTVENPVPVVNSPVTETIIAKVEPKTVTEPTTAVTAPVARVAKAVPVRQQLFIDSDKEELLLNSEDLTGDGTLISSHNKFETVYSSLLGLDKATLADAVDKYGFSNEEIAQNLSDEDIQKLSETLTPVSN
ncbi:MAG: hypothetical protein HBSAPP04_15490 [Ignavibacteriaceae bacterium]|nr:MAG: hypothetical protein EDM75_08175 [Chlorobiota bacterium]GJQ32710.1 MAG: hypothetical protein HBSAPP04_15490 [Ignavibacteriaceae bacterium]